MPRDDVQTVIEAPDRIELQLRPSVDPSKYATEPTSRVAAFLQPLIQDKFGLRHPPHLTAPAGQHIYRFRAPVARYDQQSLSPSNPVVRLKIPGELLRFGDDDTLRKWRCGFTSIRELFRAVRDSDQRLAGPLVSVVTSEVSIVCDVPRR